MIRLICDPDQVENSVVNLTADQIHYLSRVMRRRSGDAVEIQIPSLGRYLGELFSPSQVRMGRKLPEIAPLSAHVILYQALLKQGHFAEVVERATEAGVSEFVPLVTERALVRSVSPQNLERWKTIAREASEQSQRSQVPLIHHDVRADSLVLPATVSGLLLDPDGIPLTSHLYGLKFDSMPRIALAVGPEGGFSDRDRQQLVHAGLTPVSLGPQIFRAVNAGAFATVVILTLLQRA
ncbi:MAG: 16S rRNA (uracil(1498)-N(3))-methyltransferase [Firmicutes bacterium]|nr:16S rRNA (uracil(1498)-N(3))-methyltransferase [Bacillota bacterium]